jgi:hypothetical protein
VSALDVDIARELAEDGGDRAGVEPRWPIVLTLGVFAALTIVLRVIEPKRQGLGPHWLVPAIEIALTVVGLVMARAVNVFS